MDTAGAVIGLVIVIVFMALWVAAIVYWVMAIVEVAKIPDQQFRATGSDKVVWILLVVLAGIVGALIWRFAKRNEVLAAAHRMMTPPPGWYPDPGGHGLRWWDGLRWTEARHLPTPAPGPWSPSGR